MAEGQVRPNYYKGRGGLEVIHLIHALELGFDAACVIKYVCRHGRKQGKDSLADLEKARTYLDFMIAEAKGEPVIRPDGWVQKLDVSPPEPREIKPNRGIGAPLTGVLTMQAQNGTVCPHYEDSCSKGERPPHSRGWGVQCDTCPNLARVLPSRT